MTFYDDGPKSYRSRLWYYADATRRRKSTAALNPSGRALLQKQWSGRACGLPVPGSLGSLNEGACSKSNRTGARTCACAKTVPESNVFIPFGLPLSESRLPDLLEALVVRSKRGSCWSRPVRARGGRAARLRYAPTRSALFIMKHLQAHRSRKPAILPYAAPEFLPVPEFPHL